MEWYWWSLILFVIGLVEQAFDEYENLVSVRLKVQQTFLFAEINRMLEGVVYLITLSLFWTAFEAGNFSIGTVVPYFFYIQGNVLGTILALLFFKSQKKKTDREKRMQHLDKANRIKKQLKDLRDDIVTEVETEMEFEDETTEQESQDADKEIHNQAEGKREASKKEEHKEIPPPQA